MNLKDRYGDMVHRLNIRASAVEVSMVGIKKTESLHKSVAVAIAETAHANKWSSDELYAALAIIREFIWSTPRAIAHVIQGAAKFPRVIEEVETQFIASIDDHSDILGDLRFPGQIWLDNKQELVKVTA